MPESTQIIKGMNKRWILKSPLDSEEQVWSAYDFSLYLEKADLRADHIVINPMTRTRFLQECSVIFREPQHAVRFLVNPSPAALEAFSREIETLGAVHDPRIVRIHDYKLEVTEPPPPPEGIKETEEEAAAREKEGYLPFYVMDKIQGQTLENLAGRKKAYEGKIHESLALMKEIGLALVKAHKAGLVHRDLKPKNIFIRDDGSPVIIDIGACQLVNGHRHMLVGGGPDSSCFFAPELGSFGVSQRDVCPANDVYSFGKLLYYLVSGGRELPRESHRQGEYDLRKKDPSRPMELMYKIFDRTITGDLSRRVQSVEELLTLIDREMQEGATCVFCGKGTYKPISKRLMQAIWHIEEEPGHRSYEARLLVCDNCGNIQNFCDTHIISDSKLDEMEKDSGGSLRSLDEMGG
jgi:serine/threonine protein kinase